MTNLLTNIAAIFVGLLGFGFMATAFLAWLTHIIVCIQTASWALLLIGGFVFPVGIVHGFGLWVGIF